MQRRANGADEERPMTRQAAHRGPLRMMTLALTGECNLRCRYCYQNAKSTGRMPWPVLESAAERALQSTSPGVHVIFAGGEPLLALGSLRQTVEYIEQRRAGLVVQYALATNGTLLTPATVTYLDRFGFEIELSFDGVLPAQSVRGKRSFARIDEALDRLCADAPEIFWRRLSVGVTLDADAVPYLAESFSYFLEKRLPSISIAPATGQAARWTPAVLQTLDRQLMEVYKIARRHYDETGGVPLTAFRKSSNNAPAAMGALCGAADPGSVTVDVDGEVYACPMLAESSQRFANQRLAATIHPMRIGHVADPAFWTRLAGLPAHARRTGMFHAGPGRSSLHGSCLRCPHRADCRACPLAVLAEPDHGSVQRIPDYLCAFNWAMGGLRRRFPVQPDAAARLDGRARQPRLVRELMAHAGSR
jgi:sulfatase maturation enzyme AslB (radical SAM superfamily)